MKNVDKVAKVMTKILEVFHWVAFGLMGLATIISLIEPSWLKYIVDIDTTNVYADLSIYGFEISAKVTNGSIAMLTFFMFGLGATPIFVLMALIFRKLNLIIKNSENSTPFKLCNVKLLKEIGYFSIIIPLVGFVIGIITGLIVGPETVEVSNSMYGFFMGIIVLCLTQFFTHGVELEKDVDGLV